MSYVGKLDIVVLSHIGALGAQLPKGMYFLIKKKGFFNKFNKHLNFV